MNDRDMRYRLTEIKARLKLDLKIFPDDMEFLVFLEELGNTGELRQQARDLLADINATRAVR
jgi:hypothetical protein